MRAKAKDGLAVTLEMYRGLLDQWADFEQADGELVKLAGLGLTLQAFEELGRQWLRTSNEKSFRAWTARSPKAAHVAACFGVAVRLAWSVCDAGALRLMPLATLEKVVPKWIEQGHGELLELADLVAETGDVPNEREPRQRQAKPRIFRTEKTKQ